MDINTIFYISNMALIIGCAMIANRLTSVLPGKLYFRTWMLIQLIIYIAIYVPCYVAYNTALVMLMSY